MINDEMRKTIVSLTSTRCAVIDTDLTGVLKVLCLDIESRDVDESSLSLIDKLLKHAEEYLSDSEESFDEDFVKSKREQIKVVRNLVDELKKLIN